MDRSASHSQELRGMAAIVTGGSQGIGEAIARKFLAAGAAVTICARRADRVDAATERLRAIAANVQGLVADVRDPVQVRRVVDASVARYGGVHILVNNAGSGQIRDSLTLDLTAWYEVLDTHLTGALLMSQAAAAVMIEQGTGGVILNIGSIHSVLGMPRRAAYVAAKHGVIGLTRTLACEWAPYGIRVLALAPGYIATQREMEVDFTQADIHRRTPLGRFGTVDEVADVAVFLCSSRASFMVGPVVMVDGGWTAYAGW
jgi:3-oxoacyl-[acyl-carrier protein] reductase